MHLFYFFVYTVTLATCILWQDYDRISLLHFPRTLEGIISRQIDFPDLSSLFPLYLEHLRKEISQNQFIKPNKHLILTTQRAVLFADNRKSSNSKRSASQKGRKQYAGKTNVPVIALPPKK